MCRRERLRHVGALPEIVQVAPECSLFRYGLKRGPDGNAIQGFTRSYALDTCRECRGGSGGISDRCEGIDFAP